MKEQLIYYCDVKYTIRTYRGNTPKVKTHFAKKLVCSNPDSKIFKKRVLMQYFKDKSDIRKAVNAFDIKNIYIKSVCVRKIVGYANN